MNKELEDMSAEDPFLEHLVGLQEHPGWLAYQAWAQKQLERERQNLEGFHNIETTYLIRGKVQAFRLCQTGLEILIQEHIEKIKGAQER
jgi:hypothetical protein